MLRTSLDGLGLVVRRVFQHIPEPTRNYSNGHNKPKKGKFKRFGNFLRVAIIHQTWIPSAWVQALTVVDVQYENVDFFASFILVPHKTPLHCPVVALMSFGYSITGDK